MRAPRAFAFVAAGLGLLLPQAGGYGHPPQEPCVTPCQPVTVNAPPPRVVVHLSPPEVVIKSDCDGCAKPAPRCGSCCAPPAAPYYPSAPAYYAPVTAAPTMTVMPMAASYSYAAVPTQAAPMMAPLSPVYSAPVMASPALVQAAAVTYPAASPTFAAPAAPVMAPAAPTMPMPAAPSCGSGFSSPFGPSSASSAATLAGMKAFHEANLKDQLSALEDTRRSLELQMSVINPNLAASMAAGNKAASPRLGGAGAEDATARKLAEIEATVNRLMTVLDAHADALTSHKNRLKALEKTPGGP